MKNAVVTAVDGQVSEVKNAVATFVLVNGTDTSKLENGSVTISKAFRIVTTRCEGTVSGETINAQLNPVSIDGSNGLQV